MTVSFPLVVKVGVAQQGGFQERFSNIIYIYFCAKNWHILRNSCGATAWCKLVPIPGSRGESKKVQISYLGLSATYQYHYCIMFSQTSKGKLLSAQPTFIPRS